MRGIVTVLYLAAALAAFGQQNLSLSERDLNRYEELQAKNAPLQRRARELQREFVRVMERQQELQRDLGQLENSILLAHGFRVGEGTIDWSNGRITVIPVRPAVTPGTPPATPANPPPEAEVAK